MAVQPERRIVDAILRRLRGAGAFAEKNHGSAGSRIGTPDIYACVRGRFVAFEVKATGKKATVTPAQKRVLNEVRSAGGLSHVVDSVDDVLALLKMWGIPID